MSDKDELEIELMIAQIEALRAERAKHEVEAERFRQEIRWESWKAFAGIVGGILIASAAMLGAVLALANYLSQHPH